MASTYDEFLSDFYTDNWNAARNEIAGITQDINNAQIEHNASNDHDAQQHIINALKKIDNCRLDLFAGYQAPYPRFNIVKLFDLIGDRLDDLEDVAPAEIDMAAILVAMYDAEPSQVFLFCYYLEAYKAATWNATFFEEQLAELTKRWAVWA